MITVNTLLNDLEGITHKAALQQISDIFGTIWMGTRNMLSRIQPPETERQSFIEQALYNRVNQYAVPSDLDGNKVISMKLLPSRINVGTWVNPLEQAYSEDFGMAGGIDNWGWGNPGPTGQDGGHGNRYFPQNKLSIMYQNGVRYVLLPDLGQTQMQLVNDMNSLNANGTWNTFGNVVNLREDKLTFITRQSSLAFDINNSSSNGALENFTMTPVDLGEYTGDGALFMWLDITNFVDIISVKLIWASSLSDWFEYTVTGPHDNNQFINGWNLLRFPIAEATQVGAPDPSNINRLRIELVTTGQPQVNCRLDSLIARRGRVFSVNYYSNFIFRDAITGNFKEIPTSGNDVIVLEADAYNILLYESALSVTQQVSGNYKTGVKGGSTSDEVNFRSILYDLPRRSGDVGGLYFQYNGRYKSKLINPSQDSYHFMNGHL